MHTDLEYSACVPACGVGRPLAIFRSRTFPVAAEPALSGVELGVSPAISSLACQAVVKTKAGHLSLVTSREHFENATTCDRSAMSHTGLEAYRQPGILVRHAS